MPEAALVQGADGNFYGTTVYGGARGPQGNGSIFRITPSGALTTIYSFCMQSSCADGGSPRAGLLQATDGNFYGTTSSGGAHGNGTVFKITSSGSLTTLYSFCAQANCTDGGQPLAALTQATDGNFYGTTSYGGGGSQAGTVFKITPSGSLMTLYPFCSQANCIDGYQPRSALVQATDGNFYGSTYEGGANNGGTIFRITPAGALTTLYSFCSQPQCRDGETPFGGLLQGTDGNFYGTTDGGGQNNGGTVFKITPSGTLTTLYSFNPLSDGVSPVAALLQGMDGNFYGTASFSGPHGGGTAFRITPSGQFTNLYSFCSAPNCADGAYPQAALVQGTDGNLYGTTLEGGSNGPYGTVFRLAGPTPTALQFVPVTPCRLADTRQQGGSPIQGGTWQVFVVPQLGGCNIPAPATAYSLNVTVVPHGALGYLTIWPTERPQPYVSTMNSPDGRTKANAAIVPAGASGAVNVYVTDTSDVVLDINGYFAPVAHNTLQFYPLPPCRVVDTRQTNFPSGLGAPSLGAMQTRDLPILTSPCFQGLPNTPQAYSFNVTAVPNPANQPLYFLALWPDGPLPTVSTLNNPTATAVANAAIVPANPANGDVDVFGSNSTDLVIDVNGYFAAPASGGYSFYPAAPCRGYDSRNNNGQPFTGELTVDIANSPCMPPSNATAYVFNATVVPSGGLGFLTLWPDGQPFPLASTLNAYDGATTSNLAIMPNTDGSTDAFAGGGYTQLILDISGYFAQ